MCLGPAGRLQRGSGLTICLPCVASSNEDVRDEIWALMSQTKLNWKRKDHRGLEPDGPLSDPDLHPNGQVQDGAVEAFEDLDLR